MEGKLAKVLSYDVLKEIINESTPVEEVVMALFGKGAELSQAVTPRRFESVEAMRAAHNADDSELVELEGSSSIVDSDVVILKDCPMAETMKKFKTDGKLPAFHTKLINDYKEQNEGANAILHPGCIVHQIARQLIVKEINIRGVSNLNFYQLACRNMVSGEVVYDDNGLEKLGMSKEKALELVDGYACLYAITHS